MKDVRSLGILDYRKIQELRGGGVLLFAPCRIHLRRTLVTARGSMNQHTKISDRAHPSQGKGRAQIVVEFKRDLPFEIVWGSQGGAAECCADPK
jgi:hypothetical protein